MFDLNAGNRYTYVEDDPVNLVDPSGKSCVQDAVFGLISALGTTADAYLAGLGLFAVAAGEATLTAGLAFSWLFAPFAIIATAYAGAAIIDECLGQPFTLQLF